MCGIFGIYSKTPSSIINEVIYRLSLLQHRGKDGAGIAYITTSEKIGQQSQDIKCIKRAGLVKEASDEIPIDSHHTFSVEAGSKIEDLNEGFFRKLIGGATGFIIGPTIGKVIAMTASAVPSLTANEVFRVVQATCATSQVTGVTIVLTKT